MKTLFKVLHGSRLYRLHNDRSDYDYKEIVLPKVTDCLLGFNAHVKRKKEENSETEIISLQKFCADLSSGQAYCFDLLHCNLDNQGDVICGKDNLAFFTESKKHFYTSKMQGMLGYAKSQASQYALKAERLEAVRLILQIIEGHPSYMRMSEIWSEFPTNRKHIYTGKQENNRCADKRFIEVAGKKLPATISLDYASGVLTNLIDSFGERVKDASETKNTDYKSLSHAFRIAYQLKHIYLDGDFKYPLPEHDFIYNVKYKGESFVIDKLQESLHTLVQEVEELSAKSSLPKEVDHKFIHNIILSFYGY
jgi:uncharacterized LabA/DUF88 family protein